MAQEVSRRSFLKLAAATGAAAAVPGCQPAARHLVPYVVPDENVTPGVATFYATTCAECPAGCAMVATVREGRVIKLEGNPKDPIGGGRLCARGQAGLQELYNPDRLPAPRRREQDGRSVPVAWDRALKELRQQLQAAAGAGRDRVMFLGAPQGPTMQKVVAAFLNSFNSQRAVAYEAIDYAAVRAAARRVFGRSDLPVYRLDAAEVLISFGNDFLETYHSPVEYTRQWAEFRAPRKDGSGVTMGRAWYVGPRLSLTAQNFDEWLPVRPGGEAAVALGVLHALADKGAVKGGLDAQEIKRFAAGYDPDSVEKQTGVPAATIRKMAEALASSNKAVALAAASDEMAQVAAMLINVATGNLGSTMFFSKAPETVVPSSAEEVAAALQAMKAGEVDVLIISGTNPVFTMPAEMDVKGAIGRVKHVVWCGTVPDETADLAHLLLPIHHPLESWEDASPRGAVMRLRQPVTVPVFNSRQLGDLLLELAAAGSAKPPWKNMHEALMASWGELGGTGASGDAFEAFWAKALSEGGLFTEPSYEAPPVVAGALSGPGPARQAPEGKLILGAYPHFLMYDGRGADKPWLQETPEPVTQIVWDSWAEIHPETAGRLGLAQGRVVRLRSQRGEVEVAVLLSERVVKDAILVPIGQGHSSYGRYARGRGANVWRVLGAGAMNTVVEATATDKRHELVTPAGMPTQMGRPIFGSISLSELKTGRGPERSEEEFPEPWEMYAPRDYPKHHWGMTIDLNACTGCSACVVACYAENNVPVVGREMVREGRIMSWIRVERYFPEKEDAPLIEKGPMLCQQCDHAPCEPVCPVFASYHTDEGLNGQIYNRCIGTRYCSNNCPYKVRRFNWYKPEFPRPLDLQLNPDVTVRGAGVMEKCTFCIQRIRFAEMSALVEDRPVREGEIVPACAQTCPANAITFGDMNNPESAMMRLRREHAPRNFKSLEELNTQPSIVYLRQVYRERGEA